MKKISVLLSGLFLLLLLTGDANATLVTIGTADYDSDNDGVAETYKLIYAADSPFGPITWLDYSHGQGNWTNQMNWAQELNKTGAMAYSINPIYKVNWENNSWRLPSVVDGDAVYGYDGTTTGGYNITSSEMGQLFYEELGNFAWKSVNGNYPQTGWGLNNTGNFDNLGAYWYWSGTEFANNTAMAWGFSMYPDINCGAQSHGYKGSSRIHGLAVRSGQVSIVPEPATMLLFGVGLLGIAGMGRRRNK